MVVIRLAVDLGIFKILAEIKAPTSIQQLVEGTGADATLLGRILRSLASIDAVAEAGPEMYAATKISRAFTTPKGISGAGFLYVHALTFLRPTIDPKIAALTALYPVGPLSQLR